MRLLSVYCYIQQHKGKTDQCIDTRTSYIDMLQCGCYRSIRTFFPFLLLLSQSRTLGSMSLCGHSWSICLMHITSFQMIYYFLMFGCGNNVIPFDFLLIFFFFTIFLQCFAVKIKFNLEEKPNRRT